ncbi:MAG: DUF2358 domain-containing protein [Acaryochloris sp. RU_4_1]|nr:DUF2358 domain-containing protein [Acaryochloris sp. RU_4_1]NJR55021.1 DUF2358 domain-containing protein [Acaryochloris sp. CRU_2_0]
MTILAQLRQDYARFPEDQSFDLYAEDVYFQDPLNRFCGVTRYRQMIGFIQKWFINTRMDVHSLEQQGNQIHSRWTLSWQAPLPWQPHMAITGRSELTLNESGLVCSHIDYWDCSRLSVFKQLFFPVSSSRLE